MTTQTTARTGIKKYSVALVRETFFLVINALGEMIEKSLPAMKEIWYYVRWTMVIACVFCAYDVLKLTSGDNGILGIFPGANRESLAYSGDGTLYVLLTIAWISTIILLISPYLFHYFLIRRPDLSIDWLKRSFYLTEE